MQRYYGKYRGTVSNNIDPLNQGRLLVQVPAVSNIIPSSWALPCLPFAGTLSGFFVLPAINSAVWVEFEGGDVRKPIWTGGFWAEGQIPPLALAAPPALQQLTIQTTAGNTLLVSDVPGPTGGILLQTVAGAFISISDTGIIISNGQGATIAMTGPAVTVNQGAMEVI
jgi:uncharacterized protein involved in type VI secretion and phage assembly